MFHRINNSLFSVKTRSRPPCKALSKNDECLEISHLFRKWLTSTHKVLWMHVIASIVSFFGALLGTKNMDPDQQKSQSTPLFSCNWSLEKEKRSSISSHFLSFIWYLCRLQRHTQNVTIIYVWRKPKHNWKMNAWKIRKGKLFFCNLAFCIDSVLFDVQIFDAAAFDFPVFDVLMICGVWGSGF